MSLESYPVIDTGDPEQMRGALLGPFQARSFDLASSDEPFHGVGNLCQLAHVGLSYCRYEGGVRLGFHDDSAVRQQIGLSGTGRTRFRSVEASLAPGRSCLIPAGLDFATEFGHGYTQLVLRISTEALTRKLIALLGGAPSRPLEFFHRAGSDDPAARRLHRLAMFVAGELDASESPPPPLVLAELDQALMISFLAANPNTCSSLLETDPAAAAPWQVRKAEEFIAAHWHEPLTVEAIAAATGVSVRSIFKSFRDSRGTSPMAFLKQVRLRHAHALLIAAHSETSVTGVAFACGFHSLGHFSAAYQRLFGEFPSETLRRPKGGGGSS